MDGQLMMLDTDEILSKFMGGSTPDWQLFRLHVGGLIARAGAGRARSKGAPRRRVRAYGEMVDVLWRDGNADAAVRLEELWNELAEVHRFDLLCAYPIGHFDVYSGRPFERAVADQLHFLGRHVRAGARDAALAKS